MRLLRCPTRHGNSTGLFQSHWGRRIEGRALSLPWNNLSHGRADILKMCKPWFTRVKPRCPRTHGVPYWKVLFISRRGLSHYVTSNPNACMEVYNWNKLFSWAEESTVLKMSLTEVRFHEESVLVLNCFPFRTTKWSCPCSFMLHAILQSRPRWHHHTPSL